MKTEYLFKILGQIDETLIEKFEAGVATASKKILFKKLSALSACAVFLFGVGFAIYATHYRGSYSSGLTGIDSENLPLITLDTEFSGGMGFEGYMAYDIKDLVKENPYTTTDKIAYLPVYKNIYVSNFYGKVESPNIPEMKRLLKETAARLGMDSENLEVKNDIPDEEKKKKIIEKLTRGGGTVPEGYFDLSLVFMEDENIKVAVDLQMVATSALKVLLCCLANIISAFRQATPSFTLWQNI